MPRGLSSVRWATTNRSQQQVAARVAAGLGPTNAIAPRILMLSSACAYGPWSRTAGTARCDDAAPAEKTKHTARAAPLCPSSENTCPSTSSRSKPSTARTGAPAFPAQGRQRRYTFVSPRALTTTWLRCCGGMGSQWGPAIARSRAACFASEDGAEVAPVPLGALPAHRWPQGASPPCAESTTASAYHASTVHRATDPAVTAMRARNEGSPSAPGVACGGERRRSSLSC